ncbi:hypothetical protein VNO77_19984 [Canavalia gladiata]|uniref:Uncharacterized protein n=1 Tax=Canavalia gladiata TaxID=3824 RepID=A0AAN9LRY0_CANGL
MVRKRIQLKQIKNKISRQVTFSERRMGFCKKAREIFVLFFQPVSKLDSSTYGSVKSALKEEHIIFQIEGMSFQQVQKLVILPKYRLGIHASMEPLIIAAHRQSSVMYPIFKLLHPHIRYTVKTNAKARQALTIAKGTIDTDTTFRRY